MALVTFTVHFYVILTSWHMTTNARLDQGILKSIGFELLHVETNTPQILGGSN